MATLAELLLASRTGNLAGLFGTGPAPVGAQAPAQAVPQRRQGTGGVEGVLGTIFAGPDDPALSDPQNAAARRRGIIQAGLAALAGSSSPVATPSLGQVIGGAAAVGQQAGEAQRQSVRGQAANALRSSILSDVDLTTPAGRTEAVQRLIGAGFGDAAEIINEMPEIQGPEKMEIVRDSANRIIGIRDPSRPGVFDIDTGERIEVPDDIGERETFREAVMVDGVPTEVLFDSDTGERVALLGQVPPDQTTVNVNQLPTADQVKARVQANNLRKELNVINGTFEAVPGLFDPAAFLPNALRSEDRRRFDAAISTFNSLVGRALSGVAIRPDEREQVRKQLEIMPADKNQPEVIADKMRRLNDWIDFVEAGTGQFTELPAVVDASGVLSDEAIRAGLRAGTNR